MFANSTIAALGSAATVFAASFFWALVARPPQSYLVRNIIIRDACGFCLGLIIMATFILVVATAVKKTAESLATAK